MNKTPEATPSPEVSADPAASVRTRRILMVASLGLALVIFGYMAFGGLGDELIYYWSPSELLDAGGAAQNASIRLGGLVVPQSIVRGEDGLTLDFEVTDGDTTVPVRAETVPPAMFRGGIGVVLEGSMGADGVFDTSRLMVKHDNEYQAPDTEDKRSIKELVKSMQFETTDT